MTRFESPLDDQSRQEAREVLGRLRARLRQQLIGRDPVIDLVLIALLADGHVLVEDFPGSGKTTLAKALGNAIDDDTGTAFAPFRRVQFTPDLLPADITGISVFDPATGRFDFRPGPVFTHVLLADEINRTSPKVQAALLEAMAEKQVTLDNQTHALDELFFVIATQNPRDLAGTYPLPPAQLDRFLFKIRMEHIDREAELEVLRTRRERRSVDAVALPGVSRAELLRARATIDAGVEVDEAMLECLVDIAQAIRADARVAQAASTRSLVLALPALQARALLHGRDFVSAEDIEDLLPWILAHRIEAVALSGADARELAAEMMLPALERLARRSLRR